MKVVGLAEGKVMTLMMVVFRDDGDVWTTCMSWATSDYRMLSSRAFPFPLPMSTSPMGSSDSSLAFGGEEGMGGASAWPAAAAEGREG